MKKFIVIFIALIMAVGLCSCGGDSEKSESSKSPETSKVMETFEYLSYTVPSGYEQSEGPSVPLYSTPEGDTIYIVIEQSESDDVTVGDMLTERMKSNKYSEITPAEDVCIDGVTAKQYYSLDIESNTTTLNVAFVHNDDLVTISMWTVNAELSDDALADFSGFTNSVKINNK